MIMKYRLIRKKDGLVKEGNRATWVKWKDGEAVSNSGDPKVGDTLLMGPFNPSFLWHTTQVTEILENSTNEMGVGYIHFMTKNSEYELFIDYSGS
jgi:hypothetical protein